VTSEGYVTTQDGVRLFFRRAGSGPKAVLIPNGMYLLDDLEYLAGERTLIFYDLRNRGRSDHVNDRSKLAGAFITTLMIWTPSAAMLASVRLM